MYMLTRKFTHDLYTHTVIGGQCVDGWWCILANLYIFVLCDPNGPKYTIPQCTYLLYQYLIPNHTYHGLPLHISDLIIFLISICCVVSD